MCRTKIFIRYPKTLFETEDAFQAKKNDIAVIIQCRYKGRLQKKRYQQMRWAAVVMQKYARRFLAKREMRRRQLAVEVLRRYLVKLKNRIYLKWLDLLGFSKGSLPEMESQRKTTKHSSSCLRSTTCRDWPNHCPHHCLTEGGLSVQALVKM